MSSLPEKHYRETEAILKQTNVNAIGNWLLTQGYYPEQYVLPPCFHINKFEKKLKPYYEVKKRINKKQQSFTFYPKFSEFFDISFPKSKLVDRVFSIIEPKIYHDLVWYFLDEWTTISNHLFDKDNHIFSYSFPIPISKNESGNLGHLRSGRMIYEFIEMAEKDLVAEAHNYKYKLETDIKNFYPSVYTHSLAWALHGKLISRTDRSDFQFLGTRIDKLFQASNDGCTNGLPIGPVVSDIATEILLSAIDKDSSRHIRNDKPKIECLAVRFKDDYKILFKNLGDADRIIKILQNTMHEYNLCLNEGKTQITELPEGLYRPWIQAYQLVSLKPLDKIKFKQFENTLLAVLNIDKSYPDTGIIDKFLSELISDDHFIKIIFQNRNEILKTISLLLLLKQRREKSFPQILAIIELIWNDLDHSLDLQNDIYSILVGHIINDENYLHQDLWLIYLLMIKGKKIPSEKIEKIKNNELIQSLLENNQKFFMGDPNIDLFTKLNINGSNKLLSKHLAIFSKR